MLGAFKNAKIQIVQRFNHYLAEGGYVPVSRSRFNGAADHSSTDKLFFVDEYRRLDNPRYRAVVTLALREGINVERDIQVTFSEIDSDTQPVTLSCRAFLDAYKTNGWKIPFGKPVKPDYSRLSLALEHNKDIYPFTTRPAHISADRIILTAPVQAQAGVDEDTHSFSYRYRRVCLSVAPADKTVSLHAEGMVSWPFKAASAPETFAVGGFADAAQQNIRSHINELHVRARKPNAP